MALIGVGLSKSFVGRTVLKQVDIQIADGEIHALLGANGSGKSTLVKILTGVYQPDAGSITVAGRQLSGIASPHQASELGIAVVHQEAPLIDTRTVSECIALFRGYPMAGGHIQWGRLHRQVGSMLEAFGVDIDPRRLAATLSAAERALIALIIALDRTKSGLQLLVLDEVTASLPRDEAEPYLNRVSELARSEIGVLMVTHRLAELRGRVSRVTLLRDGSVTYSAGAEELDEERVVAEMVDTTNPITYGRQKRESQGVLRRLWDIRGFPGLKKPLVKPGEAALDVKHLSGALLHDVSLQLRAGEIVGVAGLVEGGIAELPQILGGLLPHSAGSIVINGRRLPMSATPREAIEAGLVLLPADRLRSGGIGTLSVAENAVLPDIRRYWHQPRREAAVLERLMADFDVRPRSAETLFVKLSGGNQQKVLLGKWLLLRPAVFVLDDPTSGVDPAARTKIFEILREAAREGIGILLFSTEPEQLASLCSRLYVLQHGVVATELSGRDLTPQTISRWCYA